MQSSPVKAVRILSSLQGRPTEPPEDCSFWMFSPILVFHVKIIMGQKIFLRMWCRLNFYCTEYCVIYNVNTLKKKELIFYMMHEMKCIVCYLQLWICFFSCTQRKKDLKMLSGWYFHTLPFSQRMCLFVCLHSRQCRCCLLCHSLFNPWLIFSHSFIKLSKW